MPNSLQHQVDQLKALAHPMRLRILALLKGRELCVCQVLAILGTSASTVSEHLTMLRRLGFLIERKESRRVYYRLSDQGAITPLLNVLLSRLDALPEVEIDRKQSHEVSQVDVRTVCATVMNKVSGA